MLGTAGSGVRWRWALAAMVAVAVAWVTGVAGCARGDAQGRTAAELQPRSASAVAAPSSAVAATSTARPASTRGGNLVLRIGGARAGVDQDVLRVDGKAFLAGRLQLRFAKGYTPAEGVRFTVVQAREGIDGSFSSITNDAGLHLTSSRDTTHLYLTVTR